MITRRRYLLFLCLLSTALSQAPVQAQDTPGLPHRHHGVDWAKLNLSAEQNQQINHYQSDWNAKYTQVMPQIHHQRQHLQDLFRNPQSDPLEIISTQQTLTRLQEQLRNEAMANYLRKRALLNSMQQRQLEAQMNQMVVERQQRPLVRSMEPSDENGGIMSIMEKVKWAIGPH